MTKHHHKCLLWSPGIKNHRGDLSLNLGDQIIEQAVTHELHKVFGTNLEIDKISTHQRLGPGERQLVKDADSVIVGGSNLLSSYMDGYFQWDLTMANALSVHRAILMGAGWWKDQGKCNRYTQALLWTVLSWKGLHSVRDSQALAHLQAIGIRNVVNTGCPTMWPFLDQDTSSIRITKGDSVLVMLTDYYPEPEVDRRLLKLLSDSYGKVFFWPQGKGDMKYALELGFSGTMLDYSLEALDQLLCNEPLLDYLGTRLHGGVRCLKAGKRCLTIEVDNRAREIACDTDLPTVVRGDFEAIQKWIQGSKPFRLKLPGKEISRWRAQFKKLL